MIAFQKKKTAEINRSNMLQFYEHQYIKQLCARSDADHVYGVRISIDETVITAMAVSHVQTKAARQEQYICSHDGDRSHSAGITQHYYPIDHKGKSRMVTVENIL